MIALSNGLDVVTRHIRSPSSPFVVHLELDEAQRVLGAILLLGVQQRELQFATHYRKGHHVAVRVILVSLSPTRSSILRERL